MDDGLTTSCVLRSCKARSERPRSAGDRGLGDGSEKEVHYEVLKRNPQVIKRPTGVVSGESQETEVRWCNGYVNTAGMGKHVSQRS